MPKAKKAGATYLAFFRPDVGFAAEPRPLQRELWLVAVAAILLSGIACAWCAHHHLLLLYGDAVAHLQIARRVFDTRNPALSQLGSVWLPLPHVLLIPFVQVDAWWRNGFAGMWLSAPSYVFAVLAMYRLARSWLDRGWAAAATALFACNPALLYFGTTAMTEPLFLALMLWAVVWMLDTLRALDANTPERAARPLFCAGVVLAGAVLTRYDGWIFAAIAGLTMLVLAGPTLWRAPVKVRWAAAVFAALLLAAPALWLGYNAHYFHDPLDFIRGPYSAKAIEERTRPAGGARYPGYHRMSVSWFYYLRSATQGAGAWVLGRVLLLLAEAGSVVLLLRACMPPRARGAAWLTLLLWFPLPFYTYSVAYGSVPIFMPVWDPHSYYNTRYGIELLPALSLLPAIALAWAAQRWTMRRTLLAGTFLFAAINAALLMRETPLVLQEARANSATRIPFETRMAAMLAQVPANQTVLINSSEHAGAMQQWGRPLRSTINESDWYAWQPALADPASVPWVLAAKQDDVARAVATHPRDLQPVATVTQLGQGTAVLYRSVRAGVR